MVDRMMPRVGAATGIVYFLLLFGLGEVHKDSAGLAALEVVGLLMLIPFLGLLYSILRQAEGPAGWLAPTFLAGGIVSTTIKVGSVVPHWVSGGTSGDVSEALTMMDNVAFMVSMIPLGIMMAAVAIISLKTRVLPMWLGWLAALLAPALVANGAFLDAGFGPVFLVFGIWVLLTSVTLWRGSRATQLVS